MDTIDRRLLAILRTDGRASISKLAELLKISRGTVQNRIDRLTAEGYRQHVVYQPAKHFWPLQWVELALFLVVSGLLTGFCFWWVRRRLS